MKILQLSIKLLIANSIFLAIICLSNFRVKTEEINTFTNQSTSEQVDNSSQDNKLDFSGDGRPGRRSGGGSRSPCPASQTPLTALVPQNNMGTTVSDRPKLWFYVPYSPQQISSGEFVLQDEQENDVYRQTFNLPKTPGLVSLKIPQTSPPLAINQSYRWYFKLYCGDSSSSTANFVDGWIKRITLTPALKARLRSRTTPIYQEYGKNLIWLDSLDNLAQLRLKNDNSQLERDWTKLLTATGVNLSELIHKPLVVNPISFNR
ncbi:DUF928 domain-containing protein [Pleurocapsa sp. PCC 7319]|uniref:DUF928 domain-containing protein n=1 Tax=Pleurocapsa sp. PCC 7319 TaxID=118161 RepID=UPI00034C3288|nr:DUF928 domain-containing protein [Pleurocapsa sp. PCC 7319]